MGKFKMPRPPCGHSRNSWCLAGVIRDHLVILINFFLVTAHTENIWQAHWDRKEEVSVDQNCPRLGPASPQGQGCGQHCILGVLGQHLSSP